MNAKDELVLIRRYDIIINQHLNQINELKASAICISAIDYSKDKIDCSQDSAGFVKIFEKISDIEIEIDKLVDKRLAIIEKINKIDNSSYIELLFARYVSYKSFSRIALELGYSERHVLRLHSLALEKFRVNEKMS